MNDIKKRKKSSKEKNNIKIKKDYIHNKLLIKKDNKGINLSNNNIQNNIRNLNTDSKNPKKDNKNKLNHINLKNIIKKIDLYSLSLTKKTKNIHRMKKREKNKINLDKKNNSHFIKLNFDKTKNEKKFEKIKFIRKSSKNSDKIRSYKKINNTIGNISNHKYKKENKKNETKIELSKLFIKNFDKENYINLENKFLTKNSKNLRTTENKTLYKKLSNNINRIRTKKLYESDLCISKKKKTEESLSKKKPKRLRRNNTEIGLISLNLDNVKTSQNNINRNNNTNVIIQKKIRKKKLILNDNQILINISNTKKNSVKKNINNTEGVKCIKKELKNYVLKRENSPDTLTQNKFVLNSSRKTKKENYKNKIPKPIVTTSINTYYNTNEIKNTTKVSIISYKSNKENKRHFSTDILDNRIDFSMKKTESDLIEENKEKIITKNYLINDALINIRELSYPGITKDGQIKLNQDSYVIQRNINYIKNFNIFAIFDGHGFNGHIISEYLKENLIKKFERHPIIKILKNLDLIYSQLIKDNYKIIREIFHELDNDLLNNKELIDINLSGSTCTLIIQIGDNIICANIGDSKAILVYEDINISNVNDVFNKYKNVKLSRDCTPHIETEKMRILMNGGNIIQLKNNLDKENGSLRIFLKDENIPGLSITRSFGDRIGKNIGVISNPVINEYTLNKSVKFIIIASSGVWRFMKEKEILNLGIKYYLVNDPDNFCNIIANKASELCKKNLGYIDDIIYIYLIYNIR